MSHVKFLANARLWCALGVYCLFVSFRTWTNHIFGQGAANQLGKWWKIHDPVNERFSIERDIKEGTLLGFLHIVPMSQGISIHIPEGVISAQSILGLIRSTPEFRNNQRDKSDNGACQPHDRREQFLDQAETMQDQEFAWRCKECPGLGFLSCFCLFGWIAVG